MYAGWKSQKRETLKSDPEVSPQGSALMHGQELRSSVGEKLL